ncbi:MAG: alanine/glycine:cation symporter family protein [Myxococcota bacterium]
MEEPNPVAVGLQGLDAAFREWVVAPVEAVLFFDVARWTGDYEIPFIVLWLVLGATFFTLRFAFLNLRAFKHAVAVTAGRYDHPSHEGEVTHFQALSSALSATVGLGNIAGVAVAVGVGGPGAVFWMIVAGFLGMSSKFTECTLGQLYREVDPTGRVSGGPMRYLGKGLGELGWPRLGKGLAALFALMCIGGSFGGGNMFQANQSYAQLASVLPILDSAGGSLVYGIAIAGLVGLVIIGGIRRIGAVAGYIVPFMCALYVIAGLYVLLVRAEQVPAAFAEIVRQAFTPVAGYGGVIGVMVQGFRRAAFSNEAGVGSAAIAHSAAATDEPVREGIVALLEPFIDTIVVCTMTGLVVVVTDAYHAEGDGVLMTSRAFASVIPWFAPVLALAVLLFAFSTMISWSYYGERCWAFLFGAQTSMIYRSIFLCFVVLGAVLELGSVITFSDLMILGMAFPNILGAVLLSNRVGVALDRYWRHYRSGRMRPLDPPSTPGPALPPR